MSFKWKTVTWFSEGKQDKNVKIWVGLSLDSLSQCNYVQP